MLIIDMAKKHRISHKNLHICCCMSAMMQCLSVSIHISVIVVLFSSVCGGVLVPLSPYTLFNYYCIRMNCYFRMEQFTNLL